MVLPGSLVFGIEEAKNVDGPQDSWKEDLLTAVAACLSPLSHHPAGHHSPVGRANGKDPLGMDGGEEAESNDSRGNWREVPQELEDRPTPVEVFLVRVRVAKWPKTCRVRTPTIQVLIWDLLYT